MSPGNTLTVDPGVTVIFDGDYTLSIGFNASIIAEGTDTEPILFTTSSGAPFPGSWNWLSLGDQALASSFDHCVFEYAEMGLKISDSVVAIANCEFRYCLTGIACVEASPTIDNCDIHDCASLGISLSGRGSSPVIHGCNIYDNGTGNVYLFGYGPGDLVIIDAENNWWGTDVEQEIEQEISHDVDDPNKHGHVDYDPWLHEVPVEATSWGRVKALFLESPGR
jgi:hypothetical protein